MLSLVEISQAVRTGEKKAVDFLEDSLQRIASRNEEINAFVFVDEPGARKQAEIIDQKVAEGIDPGPMAGVPLGIKDLFEDVKGMPTSQGSLFFKDQAPKEQDSVMVARLRAAGAVPVGKIATAEFGVDGTGTTQAWGRVRNPWNLEASAGGSSGGSSAAVSAGMVPVCTGGDGGGSIRCPASFCGLVGFKPSLGRIPRYDGFSDTTALGSLTVTVADTARYLDVTVGPDDSDRMTLPKPEICYETAMEDHDVAGLKAVWTDSFNGKVVDKEVAEIARAAAVKLCGEAGVTLQDQKTSFVNVTRAWTGMGANSLKIWFEADGYLPDRIDELSRMPRWLIEAYRDQTPTDIHHHKGVLRTFEQEVAEFFRTADLMLTPTVATTAFGTDGPLPDVRDLLGSNVNLQDMLVDAWSKHSPFCMLANFCWNPSISIPAGLTADGMPVGLMITARRHQDEVPLRLARIHELTSPWPHRPEGYD